MSAFLPQSVTGCVPYLPRLPQNEWYQWLRKRDLADRQEDYQYNYEYVSPLAMCHDVPFRDEFAPRWMIEIGERLFKVIDNILQVESDPYLKKQHESNFKWFTGLKQAATFDIEGLLQTLQKAIEMGSALTRPRNTEEYATLFRSIGIPPIHNDYHNDSVFAYMRLAGPNPVMIHRIEALPGNFPVSEKDFQVALPSDSMEAAGKEGRLFLCDYKDLEVLEQSDFPIEKFLHTPLALFATKKDTGELVPVAIQCKQKPGPDNPVFTPDDGVNWRIAKTIVSMADGNIHEPMTHLARTHLFVEPFVMATQRQLATWHPLGLLLRPHFEGTLHINDLAQKYLIAREGGVHRLCNGSIESIWNLTVKGVQDFPFNDKLLPKTFKDRGVDNRETLPVYPYRDDAMLYWDAIHEWVKSFLTLYYKDNAAVRKDQELQNWYREIVSDRGGRIKGFGQDGAIESLDYLIDAVTMIIYTSSVQHAAVNFPQYDLMSYALAMPLACYGPAPTSKSGATENDYLNMLPPLELANLQLSLGYGLGTMYYTEFGNYPFAQFRDLSVLGPLRKFQRKIKEIGEKIQERNRHRRPYKFLLPEGVPQSINI